MEALDRPAGRLPDQPDGVVDDHLAGPLRQYRLGQAEEGVDERLVAEGGDGRQYEHEDGEQGEERVVGDTAGHEREVLGADLVDDRPREGADSLSTG